MTERRNRLLGGAALAAALLVAHPALADEGMWLPEQLPDLADTLETLGLELDPATLADLHAHPLAAVISLGGCSASFVSEHGLVVTNHHCAVGALQQNSDVDSNLLAEGFLAESRADEVWAGPGSRVYVTESIEDVTETVLGDIPTDADDVARFEAIDAAVKALVSECEAPGGVRCTVPAYHAGSSYRLVRQMEIEDVRIVYAPPEMVGFYGGDEDNWMWPRHAGDFAFFRAYVGPDGRPAPHAEENVPYAPPHHLEIRTEDMDEGDFVMVAGYPGRTYRQRTGGEMAWARDNTYPWNIATMEELLAILEEVAAGDPEAAVRLQSFQFGLSNYLKNNRGMLDGFERSGAVERALARDAATRAALAEAGTEESTARLAAIDELDATLAAARTHTERDALLGWMGWGVDLLGVANTGLWLAHERTRDDADRDQGYQERDWPRIRERIERVENSYHRTADERMLAYFVERLDALDDAEVEPVVDVFFSFDPTGDRDAAAAAAAIYDATTLTDAAERIALLDVGVVDIEQARDPLLQLATALYPLRRSLHEEGQQRQGAFSRLRPRYLEAVRATSSAPVYPDANGTLRVTYGLVRGYDGPDAVWYRPFTTVAGIVEKHTGVEPFDAPDDLLEAIASEEWGPYEDPDLGTVPVDFLSTLDTTGGNSGSVTLDSQGRLCGLLFDGNYEAMASDWVFDPVRTRSIHVGAAYMLWTMDRVDGAWHLLEEMGIAPAFRP